MRLDDYDRAVRKEQPQVRSDGTCAVCKGARPEKAIEQGDPFCSVKCAKEYHDVVSPSETERAAKMAEREDAASQRETVKRTFAIMQEPIGPGVRARRVATQAADTQFEALREFIADRYRETEHQHYRGSRFEWRSNRSKLSGRWNAWAEGDDVGAADRRNWRAIVTLANGRRIHETVFVAARANGRKK